MDSLFINMLNDLSVDVLIKDYSNEYSFVIENGAITEVIRKE